MASSTAIKKGNRIAKEVRESKTFKESKIVGISDNKEVVIATTKTIKNIKPKVDKPLVSPIIDKIRDILGPNIFFTEEQVTRLNNELRLKSKKSSSLSYRTNIKYDDETMKLPNQALEILGALTEDPISNSEWVKRLSTMKTNQPIDKVLYFYKKRLMQLGLIATC
jgi:hypothetical protein